MKKIKQARLKRFIKKLIKEELLSEAKREKFSTKLMKKWAKHFPTAKEMAMEYSARAVRPIMWHLTNEPNFEIRTDWIPSDVPSGTEGYQTKTGEGELMATSNPASWPKKTLGGEREYIAALDITDLIPGKDYINVSRGYDEISIRSPEKVKLIKIYPRKSGMSAVSRLDREYPRSYDELESLWNSVHSNLEEEFSRAPKMGDIHPVDEPDKDRPGMKERPKNGMDIEQQHDMMDAGEDEEKKDNETDYDIKTSDGYNKETSFDNIDKLMEYALEEVSAISTGGGAMQSSGKVSATSGGNAWKPRTKEEAEFLWSGDEEKPKEKTIKEYEIFVNDKGWGVDDEGHRDFVGKQYAGQVLHRWPSGSRTSAQSSKTASRTELLKQKRQEYYKEFMGALWKDITGKDAKKITSWDELLKYIKQYPQLLPNSAEKIRGAIYARMKDTGWKIGRYGIWRPKK